MFILYVYVMVYKLFCIFVSYLLHSFCFAHLNPASYETARNLSLTHLVSLSNAIKFLITHTVPSSYKHTSVGNICKLAFFPFLIFKFLIIYIRKQVCMYKYNFFVLFNYVLMCNFHFRCYNTLHHLWFASKYSQLPYWLAPTKP